MPISRNCDHCGIEYTRPPSLIGKYCSTACGHDAKRKEITKHRRIRVEPTHPLAGKTGRVSEARAILFNKIGFGPHPCHWCQILVDWSIGHTGYRVGDLITDHIDNNPFNDQLSNLVPSCGPCNGVRSRKVEDNELFIIRKNGTRIRAIEQQCIKCNCTFLAIPALIAKGKGRFCSKSCMYQRNKS